MTHDTTTGTARSRLSQGHPGQRKQTKARLAISGASGAGKTWTALSVAEVLAPSGPTVIIDTEPSDQDTGAAELYADRFRFDTIRWAPPFDPRDLALTIQELGQKRVPGSLWPGEGGYDVIVVDSASHFWRGEGGTLDIADGKFGGWKEATPIQDRMVDAILRSPAHVIVCTRARMSYAAEPDAAGKQKVVKLGMAPVQRDDLEYEFQVVVQMDQAHTIEIGKTRCATLAGMQFRQNDQGRFAGILRDWLDGGVELITQAQVDELVEAFAAIEDLEARKDAKSAFVDVFGAPGALAADRMAEAEAWIAARLVEYLASVPAEAPEKAPPVDEEPGKEPDAPTGQSEPPEDTEALHAAAKAKVDEKAETAIARAKAKAAAAQ